MTFYFLPVLADAAAPAPAAAPTATPAPAAAPTVSADVPAAAAPAVSSGAAGAPASTGATAAASATAAAAPGAQTGTTTIVQQPPAPRPAQPQQESNAWLSMAPLLLMVLAFYFLMIRPQQQRDKEMRKKQGELKVGDQVITASGIYGRVVSLDNDRATLQLGEGVRVVFQRQAIVGFPAAETQGAAQYAKK